MKARCRAETFTIQTGCNVAVSGTFQLVRMIDNAFHPKPLQISGFDNIQINIVPILHLGTVFVLRL